MKKVLFVVNVGWFFVSHRLPLALAAKQSGYEVHVAVALDPELDRGTPELLASHGLILHRLQFSRSGAHLFELARDLRDLTRLFRQLSPDLVHLVTLKPVLLGGIGAKLRKKMGVVLAIPGRGSVFSAEGVLGTVRRWFALLLYRMAYSRQRTRVVFQNIEDREYFVSRHIFANEDARLIRGSGVDLTQYRPVAEAADTAVVVFASRMLREKGAEDFVQAAKLLKERGAQARFVLIGDPDPGNPRSHSREELQQWAATGHVEWWGFRGDMAAVFAQAQIVCLPTYYGEGVPKVLIEAAACGRPIVTTDMPGCRDIVRNEDNGLLIQPRDVHALANALERLLSDERLRARMGRRGRQLVESEFAIDIVTRKTLQVYEELLQ